MNGVSKITSAQDIMLIGFTDVSNKEISLSSVLNQFAKNDIVVDMISQSAPRGSVLDYSFTVEYKYFDKVIKSVSSYKTTSPLFSSGYCKINLYGEEMVNTCGVAAKALDALSGADIDIYMITTSDLDISILLRAEAEDIAIEILSNTFKI